MSEKMQNNVEWLQAFHHRLCDGDWEHAYGFKISTLDNPGWEVAFDLTDTKLSRCNFKEINLKRTGDNWIFCELKENTFRGYGGPYNLNELLSIFRNWVAENLLETESPWLQELHEQD